jgi:hypothetical protein
VIDCTIQYSRQIVREAALRGAWERIGWRMILAVALVLSGFLPAVREGDRSWWIGVGGTILLLAIVFIVAVVAQQLTMASKRYEQINAGRAHVQLTEEHFRFVSRLGAVEYPWSRLVHLQRREKYWLLGLSKRQHFIVALDGLSSEAQAFILSHVGRADPV